MNDDDALEARLHSTFHALLDAVTGECPTWGSSPEAAAEIARGGRPGLRGAFGRHPRLAVLGAFTLVLVIVASSFVALVATGVLPRRTCAGCANPAFWGIAAFDEDHLVVVGGTDDDTGKLVVATSDDAGRRWSMAYPDAPALTSLTRAGSRLVGSTGCYAAIPGDSAPTSCLYASDDGGRTWQDLHAGRLVDPSFSDAEHGVALPYWDSSITSPLTPYATSDGGRSWTAEPDPCDAAHPHLEQVVAIGSDAAEALCTTIDTGSGKAHWELVSIEPHARSVISDSDAQEAVLDGYYVAGLTMAPDGVGYLMGNGLYRTTDGGTTWTRISEPTLPESDLSPLWRGTVVTDSVAYFTLRAGSGLWTGVGVTSDGGATWSRLVCWPYFGSIC